MADVPGVHFGQFAFSGLASPKHCTDGPAQRTKREQQTCHRPAAYWTGCTWVSSLHRFTNYDSRIPLSASNQTLYDRYIELPLGGPCPVGFTADRDDRRELMVKSMQPGWKKKNGVFPLLSIMFFPY